MFCFKCGEVLENENYWRCDYQKQENIYNYSSLEPLEIGFWKPGQINNNFYMMSQVFQKPDPRRRWEGYWIHFYASEHLPPNDKPLDWIHLHFKGQSGEVELYLKEGYPNYRIVKQWGKVPKEVENLMRKFVRDNYSDIVAKIQKDLKEKAKIDWDGNF